MRILNLPARQLFHYVLTGKFKAPNADWKHEHYYLGEYELFVMTEGTLYLSYHGDDFTVKQGEYLLLPPCNSWRQGFKSAYSSFYWLHFSVSGDYPIEQSPDMVTDPEAFFTIPQTGIVNPIFSRTCNAMFTWPFPPSIIRISGKRVKLPSSISCPFSSRSFCSLIPWENLLSNASSIQW